MDNFFIKCLHRSRGCSIFVSTNRDKTMTKELLRLWVMRIEFETRILKIQGRKVDLTPFTKIVNGKQALKFSGCN